MTQRGGVYIREGSIKHMPAGRIVSTVVQTMSSVSHQVATAGEKPSGLWLIYVKTQTVQTCVCLLSAVFSAQPSNYDTETAEWGSWCGRTHASSVERRRWDPLLWDNSKVEPLRHKTGTIFWGEVLYLAFKKFCFKTCICLRSPGQMWHVAAFLGLAGSWIFGDLYDLIDKTSHFLTLLCGLR